MAVDNKKVKFEYRINQEIRSREVRLVGDNVEQGVSQYRKLNASLMI